MRGVRKFAETNRDEYLAPLDYLEGTPWNVFPRTWSPLRSDKRLVYVLTPLTSLMMSDAQFFNDAGKEDWTIDCGAYFTGFGGHDSLIYARTVNPRDKSIRGRISGVPRRVMEVTQTSCSAKRLFANVYYVELNDAGEMVRHVGNAGTPWGKPVNSALWAAVKVLPGVQLTMRYEWRVEVVTTLGFRIGMPGSPEMCRAILSLRDIPEGMSRRSALRHLVSAHTRKPDTPVVEHLRGRTEFSWNGITGAVLPSDHDLERLL